MLGNRYVRSRGFVVSVPKQVQKTNLTCFLYQFKKKVANQSSRFEPNISLILLSRVSGPHFIKIKDVFSL